MAIMKKKIIINSLMAVTIVTLTACTTVRDTTDWIPGVDSNEEKQVEAKLEAKEAQAKERQAYEDKAAFAPTRTASEADAKISVTIGNELSQAEMINREDIGIEVNAGVVTLTGNVNSDESAVSAISIAKSTRGVSRVVSKLLVVKVRVKVEEPVAE
ncbi:BON domain-containing protein [sulfur-oxidizing endosymbiont of Gigantopelta aegis]|uniref:BON domain-containing protein n=1 Tax=sulfur-oxidizing endosymbiont of Gigantopelta aegis TaxID=2794934 RepID=UPI0018DCBDED|nr:BON domain-containing protein [sulfur-oxidizing endosymbiont of Gigantopelta aegis]